MFPTFAALALACPGAWELGAAPPPANNVLVIVMDDVGPELLGCYDAFFTALGKPSGVPARTPAIDTLLAARGLMFTRAWAAPSCSPTRALALTGRLGSRTGVGTSVRRRSQVSPLGLDAGEVLLPALLHQVSPPFQSAALGKWHLASPVQLSVNDGHPLGAPAGTWFDRFAGSMFNLPADENLPFDQTGYYSWPKVFAGPPPLGLPACSGGAPVCQVQQSVPPLSSYATVNTAEDALALIATLPEPWFLWVSFNAAHLPAQDVPAGLPLAACGTYAPSSTPCVAGPNDTDAVRVRCVLESLDAQIGRLMCAVDELDTTVVLFGDNGSEGAVAVPPYPKTKAKRTMYQGGISVPLIVRTPQLVARLRGTTCDALVSVADLFATVAELSGVSPALITAEDSVSLAPYLNGASTGGLRTTVYAETFRPNFTPQPGVGGPPPGYVGKLHHQALRDERFKLIRQSVRNPSTGTIRRDDLLFDLLQGGPPDPLTGQPTPDWFESRDLLAPSQPPLNATAAAAYAALRAELDVRHPSLVQ